MKWKAYCFTAGLVFSFTWWVAVGYPNTWNYFLTLAVLAFLVSLAAVFNEKGKT